MRIQRWAVIAAIGSLTATGLHAQVRLERPPTVRTPGPTPGPPPPAGVTVTGTPAQAHITWGSVGASSYSVQRWMQSDPNCCRATSPTLAATDTSWDDPVQWKGTYVYRVSAIYPDGRQGSVDVNYVRPEPVNPATVNVFISQSVLMGRQGFTPAYWHITMGVNWPGVPGAAYYIVWGSGLPSDGVRVNEPAAREVLTRMKSWGVQTFTVGAFYLPGPVSTAIADFTQGSLNVPPRPLH